MWPFCQRLWTRQEKNRIKKLIVEFSKFLQENDELISYARSLLDPPSSGLYNFTKISGSGEEGQDGKLMGQYGQLGKVVQLFNGKKNGFFIECGALDGMFNKSLSN